MGKTKKKDIGAYIDDLQHLKNFAGTVRLQSTRLFNKLLSEKVTVPDDAPAFVDTLYKSLFCKLHDTMCTGNALESGLKSHIRYIIGKEKENENEN